MRRQSNASWSTHFSCPFGRRARRAINHGVVAMLDQVSALGAKGMPSVGVSLVSAMLCAVALLGGCGGAAPATAPAVVDAPPFDRGAAMEALNRAKQEAKTCDEIEPRVNAHVKITFAPDGSVTEAVVDVPELRGAAAACIEPFYRRVRVPAFRGAPVSVGSGIEREAGSDDASELDVAAVRAAIEAVDLSSCSELPGERRLERARRVSRGKGLPQHPDRAVSWAARSPRARIRARSTRAARPAADSLLTPEYALAPLAAAWRAAGVVVADALRDRQAARARRRLPIQTVRVRRDARVGDR